MNKRFIILVFFASFNSYTLAMKEISSSEKLSPRDPEYEALYTLDMKEINSSEKLSQKDKEVALQNALILHLQYQYSRAKDRYNEAKNLKYDRKIESWMSKESLTKKEVDAIKQSNIARIQEEQKNAKIHLDEIQRQLKQALETLKKIKPAKPKHPLIQAWDNFFRSDWVVGTEYFDVDDYNAKLKKSFPSNNSLITVAA